MSPETHITLVTLDGRWSVDARIVDVTGGIVTCETSSGARYRFRRGDGGCLGYPKDGPVLYPLEHLARWAHAHRSIRRDPFDA